MYIILLVPLSHTHTRLSRSSNVASPYDILGTKSINTGAFIAVKHYNRVK